MSIHNYPVISVSGVILHVTHSVIVVCSSFQGCGEGQFHEPSAVAMDRSGNILVVDRNCLNVQKFSNTGTQY